MELERERLLARVVDLVRDHEHRLLRLAQDLRDLLVARRDPDLRVDDEEHEVGLRDGLPRLVGDRARDRRLVGDVDAARVDQQEALRAPLADQLLAVARDARRRVHDGLPRLRQPVDERRLPDVREADDRNRADEILLRHRAKRNATYDDARPTAPAGSAPTSPSRVSDPSAAMRYPASEWRPSTST